MRWQELIVVIHANELGKFKTPKSQVEIVDGYHVIKTVYSNVSARQCAWGLFKMNYRLKWCVFSKWIID